MRNDLKHIYYIDIHCLIIREGYFIDIDYGWNHNISIYSINRNIIDVCHDTNIFFEKNDAEEKLKILIMQKVIKNELMITNLKDEKSKLLNYCL